MIETCSKIIDGCRYNFFEDRIKQYEELLKVEKNKNWWNEDMDIQQLFNILIKKKLRLEKQLRRCVIMDLEKV